MHHISDGFDVWIEETDGVRVGQHEAGNLVGADFFELVEIDAAIRTGFDVNDLVAAHVGAGWIGAVGAVRNDDLRALAVAADGVISLDQQKPGEFTMGASCRLQGETVHAGDLAEIFFQGLDHFQRALSGAFRLQRMDGCKTWKIGHFFVDARVIFHGAAAEWIEAIVDAVAFFRQFGVMTAEIDFADLWQMQRAFTRVLLRYFNNGYIAGWNDVHAATRSRFFKDQHLSPPPSQCGPRRPFLLWCSFRCSTRGCVCHPADNRRGCLLLQGLRESFLLECRLW